MPGLIDLLPYRLRESELVFQPGFFDPIEPITSPADWPELLVFEQPLFVKLQAIYQLKMVEEDYVPELEKKRFLKQFRRMNGDISLIENPNKVLRVKDPPKLLEKLQALQEVILELQLLSTQFSSYTFSSGGNLMTRPRLSGKDRVEDAKVLVLDLYVMHTFQALAWTLTSVACLPIGDSSNPIIPKIKQLVFGSTSVLLHQDCLRLLRSIDQYLWGVTHEFHTKTNDTIENNRPRVVISDKTHAFAQQYLKKPVQPKTTAYRHYNQVKVNPGQVLKLIQSLFTAYGVNGDKWKICITAQRSSFAIGYLGNGKGIIKIPQALNRGLVDVLAVLAHEIEGHLLRYLNTQAVHQLDFQHLPPGPNLLSEQAAISVENQALASIAQGQRDTVIYDYFIVQRIEAFGGDFRSVYRKVLTRLAARHYGLSLESFLEHADYPRWGSYFFNRVLRSFAYVPCSQKLSEVLTSKQLIYFEQALVSDFYHEEISTLKWRADITLHNFSHLQRLGLGMVSAMKMPQNIVAKVIWPQLKTNLDQGADLETATQKLT